MPKAFQCDQCAESFNSLQILNSHKMSNHLEKPKRKYMCNLCLYNNYNIKEVQSHMGAKHCVASNQIMYREGNKHGVENVLVSGISSSENLEVKIKVEPMDEVEGQIDNLDPNQPTKTEDDDEDDKPFIIKLEIFDNSEENVLRDGIRAHGRSNSILQEPSNKENLKLSEKASLMPLSDDKKSEPQSDSISKTKAIRTRSSKRKRS